MMNDIRENNYENYWSEGNRCNRIYIIEMNKGLPRHYRVGKNSCVQIGMDGNWRGYVNGVLIAYDADDNCNRVLIRTHNKAQKSS